jgi:adenylylsulfate kinase
VHITERQVAKLFADASCISITAFISPYRADRDVARALHDKANLPFIEVFIDAPLDVVERRDPKGLYKKARAGEIKGGLIRQTSFATPHSNLSDFTGISAPYEAPEKPELHIRTDECDVTQSVRIIAEYLTDKGYL